VAHARAILRRAYGKWKCLAGFSPAANTFNVIANALEQAMTLGILLVGALLVMEGDGFTVGMLVAFQMFASRMSQPMLRLVGLWQDFQQNSVSQGNWSFDATNSARALA